MAKIVTAVKKLSRKEAKQYLPYDVICKGLEEPLKIKNQRLRQKFCVLKELVEKINEYCAITATVAVRGYGFCIVVRYNDTGTTFVYSLDEAIRELSYQYKTITEW